MTLKTVMMLKVHLCVTEINYILKYIRIIKTYILNCNNITQSYCFCCIFDQINEAFVRDLFFLHLDPRFLNINILYAWIHFFTKLNIKQHALRKYIVSIFTLFLM